MCTRHTRDVWTESFAAIVSGRKTFEVVRDPDVAYRVGDSILFHEQSVELGRTGATALTYITYIATNRVRRHSCFYVLALRLVKPPRPADTSPTFARLPTENSHAVLLLRVLRESAGTPLTSTQIVARVQEIDASRNKGGLVAKLNRMLKAGRIDIVGLEGRAPLYVLVGV